MSLTQELSDAEQAGNTVLEYSYQSETESGGTETVYVTYRKIGTGVANHWALVNTSTKYTQDQLVLKTGDDMSGDLATTTNFDGGFAIQNRPRLVNS